MAGLPLPSSSFVGRAQELEETRRLLGETRLLTLTGVGGAGKSRLALEVARDHPDEAFFVELAPVSEPALVGAALAGALRVPVQPDRPALDDVIDHLREGRALVVVDNCEHLLEASADVAASLLAGCPEVRIVATSREALGLAGETRWPVPPLSLPEEGDAVRLFVERARQVRPDLDPDPGELAEIAAICRHLDGLPLAIELAAARAHVLSLEQISGGLSDRFHLLTGGARGAPARHRTLRGSLEWSHALLDDGERMLFRRLAVFAGGCTLDSVQAVCCDDALDLVSGLVDKSLLAVAEAGGTARYSMLETVREYATERLEESGEADAVRDRHLAHMVAFVEDADRRLLFLDPGGRALLDLEAANMRAALAHAARCQPEAGLRIGAALAWHWRERGRLLEGIEALDRALEAAPSELTPARGRALVGLLMLALHTGEFERWGPLIQEVTEAGEALGDDYVLAAGLTAQGILLDQVAPAAADRVLEVAGQAARRTGHAALIADVLSARAISAGVAEDDEAMDRWATETLAVAGPLRHRSAIAWCWWVRGLQAEARGDPAAMRDAAEQILSLSRDVQEPLIRGIAIAHLANAGVLSGDRAGAHELVLAHRARCQMSDSVFAMQQTDLSLGELATGAGELDAAAASVAALADPAVLTTANMHWRSRRVLAFAALAAHDAAVAATHADALTAVAAEIGNARALAIGRLLQSRVALAGGDDEGAEALVNEALATFAEHGWDAGTLEALELLGAVSAAQGSPARAARLLAFVDAERSRRGLVRAPPEHGFWEPLVAQARADESDAWKDGAQLSLPDAIAYARRGRGARDRPTRGWASLSETELAVARLAAEGMSNPDIAHRLFMSRSTVKAHLAHIYAKVGVSGRTELAAGLVARRE